MQKLEVDLAIGKILLVPPPQIRCPCVATSQEYCAGYPCMLCCGTLAVVAVAQWNEQVVLPHLQSYHYGALVLLPLFLVRRRIPVSEIAGVPTSFGNGAEGMMQSAL